MLRVVLFLVAIPAFAQPGDLFLSGIVNNSKTGEPIKRARVTITGFPTQAQATNPEQFKPQTRDAFSDSSGEFHFTGLTAGRYSISAQKPEFTPDVNPTNRLGPIELSASVSAVRVALSPLGVITGRIVDQDGLPSPGVNVLCLTSQVQDGQRQVRADRSVSTDDRGVYRFWNLTPGRYYIKAAGSGGGTAQTVGDANGFTGDESFAPTYFGGGRTLASAAPVEIGLGTEINADFVLNVEPAFRVGGTLTNFVPRHAVNFQLRTGDDDVSAIRATVNGETGRFQLTTPVVAGTYVLRATQDATVAEAPLIVRAVDNNQVSLVLFPPVDIPVNTRFVGTAPENGVLLGTRPEVCAARLLQTSALQSSDPLSIAGGFAGAEDGGGVIRGIAPGRYRVAISCFGGYARSAASGTHDLAADPILLIERGATPVPIEIVAAYGGGRIRGKISFDADASAGPTVLLVPQFSSVTGPQIATSFRARGDATYQFEFSGLAPGLYTLRAFAHGDIEFRKPEFLRTLAGGVAVQIDGEAEKEVTIDGVIQ